MIVTLNGFNINDGSTGAWLDVELKGLELPTVRTSTGNYAGKDGGYVGAQYFTARNITVSGRCFGSNVAALEATRAAFQNALLGGPFTMSITTNAGNEYYLTVNLLDFQMPIPKTIFQAPFKLELIAQDPIIYATGSSQSVFTAPLNPGGFTWPPTWPIVYVGGSAPMTVDNTGAVTVYPKIILQGALTNPIITNQTTNLFMGLSIVTGSSDQIIIDCAAHTITLNGGNIFGDQTSGSSFWFLQPGSNTIALATSSTADTGGAYLQWAAGVMGI